MKTKIVIGVPIGDNAPSGFMQCLSDLLVYMAGKKYDVEVRMHEGSIVATSRQRIAEYALSVKASHLMFIDSDMVFPKNLIEKLLLDGEDIVSAKFFKRYTPFEPCFYIYTDITEVPPKLCIPTTWVSNGMCPVDATGLASTLIDCNVLKGMSGDMFTPRVAGIGEDIEFCAQAREAGFRVWVDLRLEAGHIGRRVAGEAQYLEVRGCDSDSKG